MAESVQAPYFFLRWAAFLGGSSCCVEQCFLRMRNCVRVRTCVFVYAYACLCASARASSLPARRCQRSKTGGSAAVCTQLSCPFVDCAFMGLCVCARVRDMVCHLEDTRELDGLAETEASKGTILGNKHGL